MTIEFNMSFKKNFKRFLLSFLFISLNVFPLSARKVSPERQKFITSALQYQGVPYVYGGQTPKGFDCSGYIGYLAKNYLGIQLPRTANAIYSKVQKIDPKDREPGDLMFFKSNMGSDRISHIGLYCGVYHGKNKEFEGKRVFISAVSSGPKRGIVLTLIDERYWKNHFFAYGRILPPSK